jgi:N-acetyl-1-D-myo-inositol-2-amino-2-deoxy-alpha-D-glucopyranoside deacetylase
VGRREGLLGGDERVADAAGLRRLRDSGDVTTFEGMDPDGELPPFAVKDEDLTACIDGSVYVEAEDGRDACASHQIQTEGGFFALSNNSGNEIWGQEFYRLAKGRPGPVDPETGLEDDLFAGLF